MFRVPCLQKRKGNVAKTRPYSHPEQLQQIPYHHNNYTNPSYDQFEGGNGNGKRRSSRPTRDAKDYYFHPSASSSSSSGVGPHHFYQHHGYPEHDAYRQPSYEMSTTVYSDPVYSDSSSADEYYGYYTEPEVDDDRFPNGNLEWRADPCPTVGPKSLKMALGSITFTAEQGIPLGVMRKDNSFFLRVEKCQPAFNEVHHEQIEQLYGMKLPPNAEDKTQFWPEGAFNTYCNNQNPYLKERMLVTYRKWHDDRSRMAELTDKLIHLKQKRAARYGKNEEKSTSK
ncbi:unnamed protein product [Amoebophrya sp. A120]|nr:unnamed protein product [Amoebophrya sp. A120]|eukprot:GSA120T00017562001.1